MPELEPVHLVEDADNGGRFLIYGGKVGPTVELRYEGDSLWMTQAQLAGLLKKVNRILQQPLQKLKLKADRHLEAERAIAEVRMTLKRLRKSER